MKIEEFNKEMNENLKELDIELSEKQLKQFYDYMNILIEWNKVMNLTNITEPSEIIQKHFIDSLTVLKHIKEDDYRCRNWGGISWNTNKNSLSKNKSNTIGFFK